MKTLAEGPVPKLEKRLGGHLNARKPLESSHRERVRYGTESFGERAKQKRNCNMQRCRKRELCICMYGVNALGIADFLETDAIATNSVTANYSVLHKEFFQKLKVASERDGAQILAAFQLESAHLANQFLLSVYVHAPVQRAPLDLVQQEVLVGDYGRLEVLLALAGAQSDLVPAGGDPGHPALRLRRLGGGPEQLFDDVARGGRFRDFVDRIDVQHSLDVLHLAYRTTLHTIIRKLVLLESNWPS